MKAIFALVLSVVWITCSAQIPQEVMQWTLLKATNVPASGVSYLIDENCEGTGTPAAWTDSKTGSGSVNWDSTDLVLAGSQSLSNNFIGGNASSTAAFTAGGEIWASLMLNLNLVPAAATYCVELRDSSNNRLAACRIYGQGTVKVYQGTANATHTGTMATNATWYCWIHYKKGSGADAVADFEFQSTSTRVGSGNNFKSVTGAGTTDCSKLFIGGGGGDGTLITDNIRVSSSAYPSFP